MKKNGAFTFVLHSHIPYTRQAGRWPHGEEWVHEAASETYIPLLNHLNDFQEAGIPAKITLELTPILVEQLADEDIQHNLVTYLDFQVAAAEKDIDRFADLNEPHFEYLAGYYLEWYRNIKRDFIERYQGNLIPAFRKLQDVGLIEIATSAATHGYLPLLDTDESINLQLEAGINSYQNHFGRSPRAIWLPECAYRPGYVADDGRTRPGIEEFLKRHDLKLFFTETHMIEGGRPVGIAAGEAIGPYGAVTRRYLVPFSEIEPEVPATTYLPYYVSDPDVTVIGRNNKTGLQVWSAEWGYPGEFDYRDFHKKDGISGMRYWRVTGSRVDLAEKQAYHPDWAAFKVEQHADNYTQLVERLAEDFNKETGEYGFISANYDTELFGHWWFEGVDWLAGVLKQLAISETVELTTASTFLEENPPQTVLNLPEGSWGAGGNHFVWDNTDTHWVWPIIHGAESRMKAAVEQHEDASEIEGKVLNQAARELLLLQSSDWPFLITTGQAKEYAIQRFQQHVGRFDDLLDSLEKGSPDAELADQIWEKDKVFPDIDFRWFRE
jgi:1,4-alpha-glucan branching enzyme